MARQNLNIHMSQRKLLADNKDRAADNRHQKEDSARREKTSTEGNTPAPDPTTSATPAEAEEDRGGGSPEPNRPNDPTAQRRKKEDFNVFILDAPFRFDEVVETFSQAHTEYRTEERHHNRNTLNFYVEPIEHPFTETNFYTIQNHVWYANLQKETGNSRQVIIAEKHEILNRFTHFGWTFRQKSKGLPAGSYWGGNIPGTGGFYWQTSGIPGIVASPAPLPGTLDDWFYPKAQAVTGGFPTKKHDPSYNAGARQNALPSFSASNGRYIWYTTAYLERRPLNFFEYVGGLSGLGSRLRTDEYPVDERNTVPEGFAHYPVRKHLEPGNFGFVYRSFRDFYYNPGSGIDIEDFSTATTLTWRFDTDSQAEDFNPEPQLMTTALPTDGIFAQVFPEDYLNSLDGAHPMRERWEARKAQYSDAGTAAFIFFRDDFEGYHENLVYYKDTGLMIYTEALTKDGLFNSTPRIYTKKIEPNHQYFIVHRFSMPGGTSFNRFLTSHETMLEYGWKEASRKLSPNFLDDQSFRPIYHYTHRTSPKQ